MNSISKVTLFLIGILSLISSADAQIVVNGYNPRRYNGMGPKNAVSISYGYNIWIDKKNVPLPGYSSSRALFHGMGDPYSVEKSNVSFGISLGYGRQVSNKLHIKGAFLTSNLSTGTTKRFDLITTEKSKFTQLGLYGKYTLTKDLERKFQLQWIAGPELIYAKKDVFIDEYVLDESSSPEQYRQNITVTEAAVVTGLGLSYR